jgi:DNA polymerase-3 subunit delta'
MPPRGACCRAAGRLPTCRASKRDEHPIVKLVEAGSHPDMRWLERLVNEKTGNLARNISVDQVRSLAELFDSARPCPTGGSGDRFGRRARTVGRQRLLKMLEEPPPNSLFFLVSHARAGCCRPFARAAEGWISNA